MVKETLRAILMLMTVLGPIFFLGTLLSMVNGVVSVVFPSVPDLPGGLWMLTVAAFQGVWVQYCMLDQSR